MRINWKLTFIGLIAAAFLLGACKDDDNLDPTVTEKVYALSALENAGVSSGVSGTVTFRKIDNTSTRVIIQLTGTKAGDSHPAHIHSGSAGTGGSIVVEFAPVDGATGKSETVVTALKDGTAINYDGLIKYNGHVNVHKSTADIAIMIAQGNIGANSPGGAN